MPDLICCHSLDIALFSIMGIVQLHHERLENKRGHSLDRIANIKIPLPHPPEIIRPKHSTFLKREFNSQVQQLEMKE
jgi:hypothetical protein